MKQRLQYWLAVFSYFSGLDWLFYWINRKAKRVITFHNVLPDDLCPRGIANDGVTSRESAFVATVQELLKVFTISNDLGDAKSITLTFDDGYLNQYEIAANALSRIGNLPAALFVCGRNRNNQNPLAAEVVDLLLHWVNFAPLGEYVLPLDGTERRFRLTEDNRREIWIKIVRPAFSQDGAAGGENVLKRLDGQYPLSAIISSLPQEYVRLRLSGITSEQIEALRARGWRVGWHSKTHFPLRQLSAERKKDELSGDEDMKNEWFSYPYGEPNSVGEDDVRMVEAMGYPCAFSNGISFAEMPGRFFLPRMTISSNRYLLHYELSGLKHFLRYGRRLPIMLGALDCLMKGAN